MKLTADTMLNSEPSVRRIVRAFAAELLRVAADSPEQVVPFVERESYRLNALFLGQGTHASYSELAVDPTWNKPDGLGKQIAITMGIDGDLRFTVRAAFAMFASAVLDAVNLGERARETYLDSICATLCSALLGLPGRWELPA
jgi:hypothetical protein